MVSDKDNELGAIFSMRETYFKKMQRMVINLRTCFIDYNQTLDCVQHHKMYNIMRNMGLSHLIQLTEALYQENKQLLE